MGKYVVSFFEGGMDCEGHRTNAPQMAREVMTKGPEEAVTGELAEIDERPQAGVIFRSNLHVSFLAIRVCRDVHFQHEAE